MQTYISILRGINVSGQKMINMDNLRQMFENLHFKNVKTYIQSGNIIFQTDNQDCDDLALAISSQIKKVFSLDVPVLVKNKSDLEYIFNNNPFVNEDQHNPDFLHVTFLSDTPNRALVEKIIGNFDQDVFIIFDKAIYLFCPNGYGNTKLSNNFLNANYH